MRIKNLHLENFRGFEKLDIVFPEDSNVAVFIGENGSGKTSILDSLRANLGQYIRHALYYSPEFDTLVNEKDIRIGSENGAIWSIGVFQNNGENISIQNGILSEYSNSTHGEIQKYGINDNTPVMIFYGSKMYRESNGSIPKFTHSQHLANYNSLNAPLTNFIDFFNWFQGEIAHQKDDKIERRDLDYIRKEIQVVSGAIIKFLNEMGEDSFSNFRLEKVFLPPQDIYETPSKNILVIDKNKVTFEVETNLSEGEKMLIQLLADISRRLTLANPSLENPLEGTGIILIDEIELHLHPKWQRNVLPALTKTFPNVQFIVTTHSPQVLSYVPNGSVFAIENGVAYPVNSYGQDSNSLLWKNFNITEHPKFTSDLITDCAKLIENEQFEAAKSKLAELTQILGNDDSNVIELKTELDFYLQESE